MNLLLEIVLFLRDHPNGKSLTINQKVILIVLASRVGTNEKTWIHQSTLGADCSLSVRQLQRDLKTLKAKNFIQSERIITKTGNQNTYQFCPNFIELVTNSREGGHDNQSLPRGEGHDSLSLGEGGGHVDSVATPPLQNQAEIIDFNEVFLKKCSPKIKNKKIKIKNKIKKKKDAHSDCSNIDLPEWLPEQLWNEFREHRKSIKKPMSALAEKKAIQKLARIKANGHDVEEVINESIVRGWSGLFEPQFKKQSFEKTRSEKLREHWDDPIGTGLGIGTELGLAYVKID